MSHPIKSPRKLIEVALPLDAINVAAAREKAIRHGHPANLHRWWARRPLAAARAVLFAQLVNDPGYQQGGGFKYGKNKKEAAVERKRLFKIIEDLVLWENTKNEEVLERARFEIRRSWREVCELNKEHPQAAELFDPGKLPAFHDPFAGGGAIPLEAQRLGLVSYASDLNPVAVLINKAMIEIPPKFAGRAPIGPEIQDKKRGGRLAIAQAWPVTTGLAEDLRRYGAWMGEEARKRIGHLYPPIAITAEMAGERPDLKALVGQKLTVIAWVWARTVASPNPAFSHVHVPLVASFTLSSKQGKESYIEPVVDGDSYRFIVKIGKPSESEWMKGGTKAVGGGNHFVCILSDTPIETSHIRAEAIAGRIGTRLMAIVAEGKRGRVYITPTAEMEDVAHSAAPTWRPDVEFFERALGFRIGNYGLKRWSDLFTARQLVALTTFIQLVQEVRMQVRMDAVSAGFPDDEISLESGGALATAYADALAVYLTLVISKLADSTNSLCLWEPVAQCSRQLFGMQIIPMRWDFAEANPLSDSSGSFAVNLDISLRALQSFPATQLDGNSLALQADAASQTISAGKIVSTDPPYYDNIGYADLSDFFYVWMRRSLKSVFPCLLATVAVPKSEELVATPIRHGTKEGAEAFFLAGMEQAMHRIAQESHPAFPVSLYYAFKQSELSSNGIASTGWETFLEAVIRAGYQICGTWPMRTELTTALKTTRNALASCIVLVCRRRLAEAVTVSRREFLRELNGLLPEALDEMTKGVGDEHSPVAPVDLSQAIIGPGMAVFSKYSAVLEADGSPMSVRTALQLINRFLAEDDFDADTQFCLHWFEQHGWTEGRFGDADTLSRGKGTSVEGMKEAGVLKSGGGKVRLLKWSEYPTDWDPSTDTRTPIWEALHQLIRALKQGGELASGALLAALGGKAEAVRQLAYRLYTLCERLGQAEDARGYNELITSWTGIESAAAIGPQTADPQGVLFES
jgi:putative DNA methylase